MKSPGELWADNDRLRDQREAVEKAITAQEAAKLAEVAALRAAIRDLIDAPNTSPHYPPAHWVNNRYVSPPAPDCPWCTAVATAQALL